MFHVEQKRRKTSRLTDNISSALVAAHSKMSRRNRVLVYVEGYEDIAFWRNILDEYETEERKFEISTPIRRDMAKGKKVVLGFSEQAGDNLLLCVDSDFDYLFGDYNEQSRTVNNCPYVIQTYAYAIENLLCYPPSLASLAVKATKNDSRIFDFEYFFKNYSETIYPLFLWYVYAAKSNRPGILSLSDFRNTVRLNYLDLDNDGDATIEWISRQVYRKIRALESHYPANREEVQKLGLELSAKGVAAQSTHIYMQGHCLMDHVVKVVLTTVCDALRKQWIERIMTSSREGLTLRNELSYYNNSLRDIDTLLLDNTAYRASAQFELINDSLKRILTQAK